MLDLKRLHYELDYQQMFTNFAEDIKFQDATLICNDQTFRTNKLLLVLAFPIVEHILLYFEESLDLVILLPDYSASFIRAFISNFLLPISKTEMEEEIKLEPCIDFKTEDHLEDVDFLKSSTSKRAMKYKCFKCREPFPSKQERESHETSCIEMYKCKFCELKFTLKSDLTKHIRKCQTDKKYPCEVCGKTFPELGRLKRHSVMHFDERSFSCTTCGKAFTSKQTLDGHELTHSGIKKYHCSFCGKGFISSNKVKRHEVLHTGVKQFKCGNCGREFNQKINCSTHEKKCFGIQL